MVYLIKLFYEDNWEGNQFLCEGQPSRILINRLSFSRVNISSIQDTLFEEADHD